jgi:eukaryotic translation initiation factor 2C
LEDQNKFNANDMCKMTYYLCHIYARCTKSVSIPAPVYYADLAAYRAKVHASALQDSELSSSDSVTSGDSGRDAANEENKIKAYENLIKVLPNQKLRLYFM